MKTTWLLHRAVLAGAMWHLAASTSFSKDEAAATTGEEPGSADLAQVQNLKLDSLRSVTAVAASRDGRFLYASAFNSDVVAVFKRDAATGQIEIVERNELPEFRAAVSVRLSPDDQFAAVAAFRANAITLFKRSAETGGLTWLDVAEEGEKGNAGLSFVIDSTISADSRFLYTASANGVGAFAIENGKLQFLQVENAGGKLEGLRAVVISPDGATVYAAATGSDSVGVLHRDKDSGKLTVVQILEDEEDGIGALGGAFRIACSKDGRHVYVSSGRFEGDQAISVFATEPDGKLKLIEEHVNGVGKFSGFEGGNSIVLSVDDTLVYAVGSLSDRLVRFRRDAATGKLTFLGSQAVGEFVTPGAAGLCFSPDGKFLYIADEMASSIVVLKQP